MIFLQIKKKKNVQVAHDPKYGFLVPRITKHVVGSANEATRLVLKGRSRREIEQGRGHTIISVYLENTYTSRFSKHSMFMTGQLDFVNLSEKEENQQVLNCHFEINRSNLALQSLVSTLTDSSSKLSSKSANDRMKLYGDSKLTQLLWQTFGGICKTQLIGCMSSRLSALQRSLNTLTFCAKAKGIINKPNFFARPPPYTMDHLQKENRRLGLLLRQNSELNFSIMNAIQHISKGGAGKTKNPPFPDDLLNMIFFLNSTGLISKDNEDGEEKNKCDPITVVKQHMQKLEVSTTMRNLGLESSVIRMVSSQKKDNQFSQLGFDALLRDVPQIKSKVVVDNKRQVEKAKIEEQKKIIEQLKEAKAKMEATIIEQDAKKK